MIKVENITYSVKNHKIIDNISFQIEHGEMVAVIGPNGAGKSTLVNIIMDILKADSGSVYLYNKKIKEYNKKDRAKLISFVPQEYNFTVADLTVEEFVSTGRYPYLDYFGTIDKEQMDKITYYMTLTDIYHLKNRHISSLSGGEKQRVSIAAALAQEAEFIIFDEVSSNLDPKTKYDINNLLIKLNTEKKYTIISVTHDLNYSLEAKSKFLCIKEGRLHAFLPHNEMFEKKIFDSLFNMEFSYITHNNKEVIIPK